MDRVFRARVRLACQTMCVKKLQCRALRKIVHSEVAQMAQVGNQWKYGVPCLLGACVLTHDLVLTSLAVKHARYSAFHTLRHRQMVLPYRVFLALVSILAG